MSQWASHGSFGAPATSGMAYSGSHVVGPRDQLDGFRMGGRTPEAQYPDGYLGTIKSRREDRLLDAVKQKIGDRSYQRGVHKGIRIDPGDYEWPVEFGPQNGIKAQARGVRQVPLQTTTEQIIYGTARIPRGAESLLGPMPGEISEKAPELRRLLPDWR